MAFKEPKSEKHYYSIGEVAGKFGLAPSTLRFWEKEFDTIKPFKNKKGDRFYTQEDIDHLSLINHMVKERGMTLKGAKTKIKENKTETENTFEIVQKLQMIKSYLLEIKEEL
ncbi:MAG TPA: MerR family transcriptional regulator [Prolixibacteraceae bacterium]|nr:MerR family transcriptional regulator [Prolixibacteraceae bacterium]